MAPTDSTDTADQETAGDEAAPKQKLELHVQIDKRSACERHITVTVSRADIDRYFDAAVKELMPKATVPGFRAGRVPRKQVVARFRKDLAEQIKGELLMDSLEQLSDEQSLSPISEPDFDPSAIQVPEAGPMTFEFDLEVRPEFELPKWQGLTIERPVRSLSETDIDGQLREILANHGRLVPHDGPAALDDFVVVNMTFKHGDDVLSRFDEESLQVRKILSLRDGRIEDFGKLMSGAKAGDLRTTQATISADAPRESLRGVTVTAEFEVLEVKKLELPEMTAQFLEQIGGFESEEEFREAVRSNLLRRLTYHQQQRTRDQVLAGLTVAADWDLPPALLRRQARRELERSVLELRRSGFNDDQIRQYGNELQQNSLKATERALKQHFVLERIAEEEGIEDLPDDYDLEIELIANQSGESPRRVRAQLEKRGLMDTLRNQIIERKVIELILAQATFKDVPYQPELKETEAVDVAASGDEADIPEAQPAAEASPLDASRPRA